MTSVSKQFWREEVEKTTPYEKLRTRTEEGILLEPLYAREDAPDQPLRPRAAPTKVCVVWEQRAPDLEGAGALLLRARNVEPSDLGDRDLLVDWGADWPEAAALLERIGASGNAGADPALVEDWARLAEVTEKQPFGTLFASTARWSDRGAHAVDQLAFVLAGAVDGLRALEKEGVAPEVAARKLLFSVALDCDQFLGICTLRALHALWARVAAVAGFDAPARIHAETAYRVLTRHDPYVNMLRGTVTCFAGIVGGAEWVTTAPFDVFLPGEQELGRRIARNTALLLLEEAHLGFVLDPAGGSWYVERRTRDLAEAAWRTFQEIERRGGMRAVLGSSFLEDRIAETNAARAAAIATRKRPITGVSEFPNLHEDVPEGIPPRDVQRFAAPYEGLRIKSDDYLTATGRRPGVFLFALGPLAEHSARATWTKNLLAAGGIEAVEGSDVADFEKSGLGAAFLCGSDDRYAREVAGVAPKLKAAGARLYLAGRPNEDYRRAGVDAFVHFGCDVLETLASLYDHLEAAR